MLVKLNHICCGTGAASRSFTSTAVNVVTRNERQKVRVERNPTKKGYMRLHTSLGDLNLELHCDLAPRTCENFFVLSEGGYYTDTIFHRSIKNFMIQVWVAAWHSTWLLIKLTPKVRSTLLLSMGYVPLMHVSPRARSPGQLSKPYAVISYRSHVSPSAAMCYTS